MTRNNEIILVTGACGFVGSHLVDELLSKGMYIRATDLPSANKQYLPTSPNLEFIPADLTKPDEVKKITTGVTKIFHPAGIFRFDAPAKTLLKVNVNGTINLLTASLTENITSFVNWSTAMIYGTLEYTPADEVHPIRPEEPYSESKWVQEQIALSYYEENGLPVTIIRPTAIYGPRSFYGTARALLALLEGKIFGIPGDGKAVQHHVHVLDVVRAAIFVSNNNKTTGEVFNIADNLPISVEESLITVAILAGQKPPSLHIPKRIVLFYAYFDRLWNKILRKSSLFEKGALPLLFSDHIYNNTKLKNLGFTYSVPTFEQGIKKTIEWYQSLR